MAKYRGREFVRPHYRGDKYINGHYRRIPSDRPIGAFSPNLSWTFIFVMMIFAWPLTIIGLPLLIISLIYHFINWLVVEVSIKDFIKSSFRTRDIAKDDMLRMKAQKEYFERRKKEK